MKIQYYSTESNLPAYVAQQWQDQDIQWLPWRPGDAVVTEHFMLFSPIWHHEYCLSCDANWKKYFAAEKKEVRLLTIGLEDMAHPNYWYLFDLPKEASSVFEKTLNCCEDWTPVSTGGLNIDQVLYRFLNGHGDVSLSQEFTKVLGFMRVIEEDQRKNTPYAETIKGLGIQEFLPPLWQSFVLRWQYHYPFFGCLPYYTLFQEMDDIIQHIDIFFQTDCQDVSLFTERRCKQNIERLNELITECCRYAN